MKIKGLLIDVIKGDITEIKISCLVNPANTHLTFAGGLARVINKKSGNFLKKATRKYLPLKLSQAIITAAGNLNANYIIHTATMGTDLKTNEHILRKCIYNCLIIAEKNKITSLGFPALGCGTGKFPLTALAKIAAQEIYRYLQERNKPFFKKIIFVLKTQKNYNIFKKCFFPYLSHLTSVWERGPFLTVDGIIAYKGGVVMVKRSNPPFGWALPGGFVDYGESLEEAVKREVKEETGLDFYEVKQFKVYSHPRRDPRFHTVSVVFSGKGRGKLVSGSDASGVKIFNFKNLPVEIAFDHREIINEFLKVS